MHNERRPFCGSGRSWLRCRRSEGLPPEHGRCDTSARPLSSFCAHVCQSFPAKTNEKAWKNTANHWKSLKIIENLQKTLEKKKKTSLCGTVWGSCFFCLLLSLNSGAPTAAPSRWAAWCSPGRPCGRSAAAPPGPRPGLKTSILQKPEKSRDVIKKT